MDKVQLGEPLQLGRALSLSCRHQFDFHYWRVGPFRTVPSDDGPHRTIALRLNGYELVLALGDPLFFLYLSGAIMVPAGIALAVGYRTRFASLMLFLTLVPITLVIHIAPDHVGPLFKNIAILGALVHFFTAGGGARSLTPIAS